jgi:hypothetical protein
MPDQSLSNEPVSGKTDQEVGNPADTAGNTPEAASAASMESNVRRASEGQMQQADVTINQDPTVSSGDTQTAGADTAAAPADNYDDENEWPYRALQQEAKGRDLDASGKRDEIVARLRGASGAGSDVPRGEVPSEVVDNGGIQRTSFGQDHAEILQGLSNERKQQQLAAVAERSGRSGE